VAGGQALYLLRALNVGLSALTVFLTALVAHRVTGNARLAAAAASSLALVPQWSAIFSMAGNDAAATFVATLATLALLHAISGSVLHWAVAGLLCGAALAVKLTTAFLLPMAVVALAASRAAGRMTGRALALFAGGLAGCGWAYARNWVMFGDPLARDFKRALLEQSNFVALAQAQPGVADPAYWFALRGQVFEAFWARFGSLGAGPDPASRLWVLYATATLALALATVAGLWPLVKRSRAADSATHSAVGPVGLTIAIGLLAGIAGWIAVNLARRPDMVVHWTPRHVLPLTGLWTAVVAQGVMTTRQRYGGPSSYWRCGAAAFLLALALGWLISLRHAIQQFYFGYP
jgi:hypothetical protein